MIEKTFEAETTFQALWDAEAWCAENGISYGSLCGQDPVGLLWGDFSIAKWKNLTGKERHQVHGRMTSPNFRTGPVTIRIAEKECCFGVTNTLSGNETSRY